MHFYILSNNEVYEVISRVLASEMVRTSYSFRFEKRESLALNEKTQNTALESKLVLLLPAASINFSQSIIRQRNQYQDNSQQDHLYPNPS